MVTPSVRTGLTNDVMLSIVRAPGEDDPTLGLRVTVQPLVVWLWIGGFVMAFGTRAGGLPGAPTQPARPGLGARAHRADGPTAPTADPSPMRTPSPARPSGSRGGGPMKGRRAPIIAGIVGVAVLALVVLFAFSPEGRREARLAARWSATSRPALVGHDADR